MELNETDLILDTAAYAGKIMLKSGAEMRRVEETTQRIAKAYGVDVEDHIFTLTNAVFIGTTDGNQDGRGMRSILRQVPLSSPKLNRVIAVNQLSHDIEAGRYTVQECRRKLAEIEQMAGWPLWLKTIAAGIGAGCFAIFFGGWLQEAAVAVFAGAIPYLIVSLLDGKISKLINNALGGAIMALITLLAAKLLPAFAFALVPAIAGAMMPLVPGMCFTNGFRDIADGDYLSGAERLLDAVLVGLSIAAGVAVVVMAFELITGGGAGL